MLRSVRTTCSLLLFITTSLSAPAAQWRDYPESKFWQQPEVSTRIDPANIDRDLLATAVFHESNRVRHQLGLKPFRRTPKVDEAADLEAGLGKVFHPPSHTNPFPMIGTPRRRVEFVGLTPGEVAENIALAPYGGNLEGVRAASLGYFGKEPETVNAISLWISGQHHATEIK